MARAFPPDQNELSSRVLRIVRWKRQCDLDELLKECASYTWTQVFLEVDRLSRTGELCLLCEKAGEYSLKIPRAL